MDTEKKTLYLQCLSLFFSLSFDLILLYAFYKFTEISFSDLIWILMILFGIKFFLWAKKHIFEWILFRFYTKNKFSEIYLQTLKELNLPTPLLSEFYEIKDTKSDPLDYFSEVCNKDDNEVSHRIGAAAIISSINTTRNIGFIIGYYRELSVWREALKRYAHICRFPPQDGAKVLYDK